MVRCIVPACESTNVGTMCIPSCSVSLYLCFQLSFFLLVSVSLSEPRVDEQPYEV